MPAEIPSILDQFPSDNLKDIESESQVIDNRSINTLNPFSEHLRQKVQHRGVTTIRHEPFHVKHGLISLIKNLQNLGHISEKQIKAHHNAPPTFTDILWDKMTTSVDKMQDYVGESLSLSEQQLRQALRGNYFELIHNYCDDFIPVTND